MTEGAEGRASPGISPAGRVMLRESSGTTGGEQLCQPARAFAGDADSGPRLRRETHTNIAAEEAYEGQTIAGEGRGQGRQGSFISCHREYTFQNFKGT